MRSVVIGGLLHAQVIGGISHLLLAVSEIQLAIILFDQAEPTIEPPQLC